MPGCMFRTNIKTKTHTKENKPQNMKKTRAIAKKNRIEAKQAEKRG